MIFIKHTNGVVTYRHFMPFDEKHGLGMTKEELEAEGMLVENIPEPEEQEGKAAVLKVNSETNELYYEYEDFLIPEEPEEDEEKKELRQEIEGLKDSQTQQDEIIMELMLGGM